MFTTTKHHPTTRGRHGTVAARTSTRSTGAELRALGWLIRHPLFWLVPAGLLAGVHAWGAVALGVTLAGLLVAVLVWWRAHPPSYDRFLAPRVRSTWRRWTAYRGRRWAGVLADCDLTSDTRTGRPLVPRVLRPAGPRFAAVRTQPVSQDLAHLAALVVGARLTVPLDRSFPMEEAAQAHAWAEGPAAGKVVITLG